MLQPSDPHGLRIVPLGGLGEIGQNCLALEHRDGILLIDCGTSFPTDDMGIDVWHPDFAWVEANRSRLVGVVLTHGHEDHIGALPYLLRDVDVPVWGPSHALALARRRLEDHGFGPDDFDFRTCVAGQTYPLGPFEIEPITVSHSIVAATAICVRTDAGVVVHSGDFNFDATLPGGERTDVAGLSAVGDGGVGLLLADSTNVDVPTREGSEAAVAETLGRLVESAVACVFVAIFASNVHRLNALGRIALNTGRSVCVLGRSLQMHVEVATELGKLSWPSDLLVSPEQAADLPRDRLLVIAGGTQAEGNSALRRLAADEHRWLRVRPGDMAILSSRIIPGNERAVQRMRCDLLRLGAQVVSRETEPRVHTSGHASQNEQLKMMELLRPRSFLPIHGTLHHLLAHATLARKAGIDDVLVIENGESARYDGDGLARGEPVSNGKAAVALGGRPISSKRLAERAELGRSGSCWITVVVSNEGVPAVRPEVTLRGVAGSLDESLSNRVATAVESAVKRFHQRPRGSLESAVRRAAVRELYALVGRRPVVDIHVMELRR